jgi:plasmid stabilization system protein ParE
MSMAVITSPEAEDDIRQIHNYYSKIDYSLAERFLNDLHEQFKTVSNHPEAFPVVYKNYRRTLLDTFPYAVFYTVEKDHLYVLAVFHQRRNLERLLEDR